MIKQRIIQGSKVLVAPLNWGLGHATRSIPIIRKLIEHDCQVVIASDGDPLQMLREEFPRLNSINLPSYNIHYRFGSMAFNMLIQLPKIYQAYKKEFLRIGELQSKFEFDYIISDGRYGIRSNTCTSIIVHHQLNIQSWNPIASAFANAVNNNLIKKFDEVWIPDFSNQKLSGILSSTRRISNKYFIGPQSRFHKMRLPIKYDLAVVLSGPEPSRSILEKKLWTILEKQNLKIAWIRGMNSRVNFTKDNVEIFPRINSEELNTILCSSKKIICRSGYSSVMDLDQLGLDAILIPTPGQTEQEYLVKWLKNNPQFQICTESNLNLLENLI